MTNSLDTSEAEARPWMKPAQPAPGEEGAPTLTKEEMALGAFLAAMHDSNLDGGKMREAMLNVLGPTATQQAAPSQGAVEFQKTQLMLEAETAGFVTLEGYVHSLKTKLAAALLEASTQREQPASSKPDQHKVLCHAEGDRCLGCDHYHGKAPVCCYAKPEPQAQAREGGDGMSEDRGPIVGHKTFRDGNGFRHEPLHESEATKIMASIEEAKREREELMPTEQDAAQMMWSAWYRLKELGWRETCYGPTNQMVKLIEPGSSGIHEGIRWNEWPEKTWWIDGDYPSTPCLFKPKDQP